MVGSLKKVVLTGLSAQGLSAGSAIITQLLTLLVLSRILSATDFGVLASCAVIMSFAHVFVDAGVGPAIVQRKAINPVFVTTGLVLSIVFGLCMYILLLVGAPLYAQLFDDNRVISVLRWQGLSFVILAFCLPSKALLEREMQFVKIASIEMLRSIIVAGLSIFLALRGFGIWSIVYGNLLGVCFYVCGMLTAKRYPLVVHYDAIELRSMIRYGGGLTLTRFFNHLAQNADTFLVGSILGLDLLGYYERALKMIRMPSLLLGQVLDRVSFPVFSRYQDDVNLKQGFFRVVTLGYLIQFPLCVAIWILAPEIVSVLLGEGWEAVVDPLRIMVLCLPFRIMIRMTDSLVRAKGAVYLSASRKAIFAIAVVLFCGFGTQWGITGAAWGALAALLLNYTLMSRLSNRLIDSRLMNHLYAALPGVGGAGLVAILNIYAVKFMREAQFEELYILIIIGVANTIISSTGVICLWRRFMQKGMEV